MRKWIAVVIVGVVLVVVVLLVDSSQRWQAEYEQGIQNIQQWAAATVTARAGE